MTLEALVDAELTPIKLLLDSVPPFLRQRAAMALGSGDSHLGTAYLQALSLELESILLQLNASIEGFLLLLAIRSRGKGTSAGYTKEGRGKWLADLEAAQGFKGDQLEGWAEVQIIRTDSNLVKHRLGLDFGPGEEASLSLKHFVELTEPDVLERFQGASQWLRELTTSCAALETS